MFTNNRYFITQILTDNLATYTNDKNIRFFFKLTHTQFANTLHDKIKTKIHHTKTVNFKNRYNNNNTTNPNAKINKLRIIFKLNAQMALLFANSPLLLS